MYIIYISTKPCCTLTGMQRLHPELDVTSAVQRVNSLLGMKPASVAGKWCGIRVAAALNDDQMVALVNYDPTVLAGKLEVVEWKLALYHAYERRQAATASVSQLAVLKPADSKSAESAVAGAAAGAADPRLTKSGTSRRERALSFPAWLANTLKAGVVRFRRLEYLMSVDACDKRAYSVLREPDAAFISRHADYLQFLQWPGPKIVDAEHSDVTETTVTALPDISAPAP